MRAPFPFYPAPHGTVAFGRNGLGGANGLRKRRLLPLRRLGSSTVRHTFAPFDAFAQ